MTQARRFAHSFLPLFALALLAQAPTVTAEPLSAEWVERWRSDLVFAADSLPRAHADFYRHLSREHYEAELKSLSERLPTLSQSEVVVELGRIIVRVGDGHSRVTYPFDRAAGFATGHTGTAPHRIPGLVFRHYSLRFGLFGDSLYVIHATAADRELLGGRVLTLGTMSAGEAQAAVEPVIQRDNDSQVKNLLPTWLVCPEILAARGVVRDPERLQVVVERPGGGRVTRIVAPADTGVTLTWIAARTLPDVPWIDRQPERAHWFAAVPGTRAIYARIRAIQDRDGATLAAFADSLLATFARSNAERLILDLRADDGGDGSLNRPLMLGLIRERRLFEPGALWALIDRGTFSAAVMLAADLEAWTPAVFVGEMTGGDPNAPGDSRRTVLPNSGITVRLSSLLWQSTDPRDHRHGITPHLPITTTYADWHAGVDPVLAAALAGPNPAWRSTHGDRRAGTMGFEFSHGDVQILLTPPGGASGGTVRSPDFGLEDTALENVSTGPQGLSASWTATGQPWRLDTIAAGPRLVGTIRYRDRLLPVVLE